MTWFDFISSAISQPQGHRMWWENSLSESQSITARRLKHSLAVKMSRESGTHSALLVFGQLQGLRERGLKVAYLISIQDGSHMQSVSVVVLCGIRNENGGPAALSFFFIIYPNHLPTHFSSYIKFSTITKILHFTHWHWNWAARDAWALTCSCKGYHFQPPTYTKGM